MEASVYSRLYHKFKRYVPQRFKSFLRRFVPAPLPERKHPHLVQMDLIAQVLEQRFEEKTKERFNHFEQFVEDKINEHLKIHASNVDNVVQILEQRFFSAFNRNSQDAYFALSGALSDDEYSELQNLYHRNDNEDEYKLSCYKELLADAEQNVDIGCGDGVLLNFCEKNSIKITGVDSNTFQLEKYHGAQKVVEEDVFIFLQNAKPQSYERLVARHFVEHIPMEELTTFFQLAHRALKPSGKLILEYPNPRCFETLLMYYFIDPTHHRPVAPELLKFLLQNVGFKSDSIKFDEINFPKEIENQSASIAKSNGYDLLVVCTK